MSVPSQQTPAPKSGLAWLTLIVSVLALVGLCVWALLNQHLLLKQNSEATQPAASNQPVSGLQQSDNSGVDRENEQPRLATNVASNVASTVASNVPSSVSSGLSTGLSSGVSANPPTKQESGSPASQDGQNLAATEDNAVVEETAESAQIENAEDKALAQEQAAKKASDEAAAEARAAKVRAAEREAAEKLAAEQEAAIKPAAEETTAEEVVDETATAIDTEAVAEKLDLEQQQVERLAALPETAIPSADNDDAATPVAPETETAFETSRREDLAKLPELATQIRFATNDTETIGDSKQPLDRMFELLFLYSETTVTVEVATNEYEIDDSNQLISRLRALVIVNYLIERGLDAGRFRIRANGQQGIPADSHQVSVVATVVDK